MEFPDFSSLWHFGYFDDYSSLWNPSRVFKKLFVILAGNPNGNPNVRLQRPSPTSFLGHGFVDTIDICAITFLSIYGTILQMTWTLFEGN